MTSNVLLSTTTTSPLLLTYLQLSLSTLAQYNLLNPLKDVLPVAKRKTRSFLPPLTLPPSRSLGNKEVRGGGGLEAKQQQPYRSINHTTKSTQPTTFRSVASLHPLPPASSAVNLNTRLPVRFPPNELLLQPNLRHDNRDHKNHRTLINGNHVVRS